MKLTFTGSVGSLIVIAFFSYSAKVLAQYTVNDDGTTTYIVRAREGSSGLSTFSDSARALNTGYVAKELSENVDGVMEAKAFKKSGFVIVKTYDDDAIKAALNRIYGVHSWEMNKQNITTFAYDYPDSAHPAPTKADVGGNNEPSNFAYGPWLKDIEGFQDVDQNYLDPTTRYDEGYVKLSGGAVDTTKAPASPSVKVAVIDTGATVNHPFLTPALSYNFRESANGANGIDEDADPNCAESYKDDIWGWNTTNDSPDITENGTDHGSHVAGIVKTIKDQAGSITGVSGGRSYSDAAHRVEILPIRFISDSMVGSTDAAIKAIDYARCRKAKVINASWGAAGKESFSQALYTAFADAYTKDDIFIAVAAGNAEGAFPNDNDQNPYFPASYDIPSLMTVASITAEYYQIGGVPRLQYAGLSDFSNYGANSVDVAAPGGYKSVNGDSSGIISANAHSISGTGMYIRKKGTSMATPVVAGIAGVIRSINPSLTAYETEQVIEKSVVKMDTLSSKVRSGGYVNARKAFDLAIATVTANLKPALPSDPYKTYSATTQAATGTKKSGGGCGLVTGPTSEGPQGPFGGNSLGLFTAAYFLAQLSRRIQRKLKSHRV